MSAGPFAFARANGQRRVNQRLGENAERSLNTSLQFVHLAFLALLLRRS